MTTLLDHAHKEKNRCHQPGDTGTTAEDLNTRTRITRTMTYLYGDNPPNHPDSRLSLASLYGYAFIKDEKRQSSANM
jgi:hypothetical protein